MFVGLLLLIGWCLFANLWNFIIYNIYIYVYTYMHIVCSGIIACVRLDNCICFECIYMKYVCTDVCMHVTMHVWLITLTPGAHHVVAYTPSAADSFGARVIQQQLQEPEGMATARHATSGWRCHMHICTYIYI